MNKYLMWAIVSVSAFFIIVTVVLSTGTRLNTDREIIRLRDKQVEILGQIEEQIKHVPSANEQLKELNEQLKAMNAELTKLTMEIGHVADALASKK